MIFKIVVNEIQSLRSDEQLPDIRIEATTPLDDLGFDSLSFINLVTRLEAKLTFVAWDPATDNAVLPSVVGDLVRMFRTHSEHSDRLSAA